MTRDSRKAFHGIHVFLWRVCPICQLQSELELLLLGHNMALDKQKGHILKATVLNKVIESVVSVLDTAFHPVSGTLVSTIMLHHTKRAGGHTCK